MRDIKKYFIITIDTEADNQWDINHPITTENAKYLPRFQELCEKYYFKPVWLTNYEMALDDFFLSYMKFKQAIGQCEIGMHLHAWNTPPGYELEKSSQGRDYLIEYPYEIMDLKIRTMTDIITQRFGVRPVSHRAGRWATDYRYFSLLEKCGYKVDCSVTPGINWSKHLGVTGIGGSDYSNYQIEPYMIGDELMEVPLTVRRIRFFDKKMVTGPRNLYFEIRNLNKGKYQWLRQDNVFSERSNIELINEENDNHVDYLMFMIHSSELMPGGSPTFRTQGDIEKLYVMLDNIFSRISSNGYEGITLRDYYDMKKEELK